jgi:hypothetical protein
MEEKELSPELTPNEIKGINLIVKSLAKKYKFITGWSTDDEYRKYDNTLFVTIKIDYDKVSDYFGMRIRPTIKRLMGDKDPEWWGREVYSLTAFLDEPEGYTGGYDTKTRMRDLAEHLYKQLPPQLQRTYTFQAYDGDKQLPVVFKVHGFITY